MIDINEYPYRLEIGIRAGHRDIDRYFTVGNYRNIESAKERALDHDGPWRIMKQELVAYANPI